MRSPRGSRILLASAVLSAVLVSCAPSIASGQGDTPGATAVARGAAPGATPVAPGAWTTGGKDGLGTSAETHTQSGQGVSKVWYTIARGQLNEVYYPQADVANVQDLTFLVTDGSTFVDNERDDTDAAVRLPDPRSLTYVQTNTARNGKYQITKTYVTDPARSTVLVRTLFHPNVAGLRLYTVYNPSLNNSSGGDTGSTDTASGALVSRDATVSSALLSAPAFVKQSTGYVGHPQSDGWQDIYRTKALTDVYDGATTPGNIVQTAQIAVNGTGDTTFTLALGFGGTERTAAATARTSLTGGFQAAADAYANGWHSYLAGLFGRVPIPAAVAGDTKLRDTYTTSLMVLKAHEDKDQPGANVASLTVPWGDVTDAGNPNQAGYHHIWARDLYQVASTQLAAGDRDAAVRSANYLFDRQMVTSPVWSEGELLQPGAFPRFSRLDGHTDRGCCEQMDQVAFPIILQWQLNHATADPVRWSQVKLAAEHLRAAGPSTPKERWEEEGGQSVSTLAAQIAGLAAAADLARLNNDPGAAAAYVATADDRRNGLDGWTFTQNGTFNDHRYYERIDRNYNPGDNEQRCFKAGCYWERDVVDGGFLELARLGVRPADYGRILESLDELDATTSEPHTKINLNGNEYWYRYNHDSYGEAADGFGWNGDRPGTVGRPWPLLSGERGEYELALSGDRTAALVRLRAMAAASGDTSNLIPEQVWDRADTVGNGIQLRRGEHTGSATPLAWATAQYIRLALSIDAGQPIETPGTVAARYQRSVTLTVRVPASTDQTGKVPYIAGELGKLSGGYANWTPGLAANGSNLPDGEALTRVDSTTWTITLVGRPDQTVDYKIVLSPGTRSGSAPNWSGVEKSTACSDLPNRRLVTPATGNLTASITVANWGDPTGC